MPDDRKQMSDLKSVREMTEKEQQNLYGKTAHEISWRLEYLAALDSLLGKGESEEITKLNIKLFSLVKS
jgi:hypothetical protein